MFRFLFRAIGLLFLAVGFVFFVYDGTKSIAGNALFYTPLSDTWNSVHSTSLQQLQPMVERYGGKLAWDLVAQWLLAAPTFAVFGVIGSLLVLIGRQPRPLIGYDR
jgi:hypothetical protein